MVTIAPTDFKAFFIRGFTYGASLPSVTDPEIQNAINDASGVINQGLYPDDATTTRALLFLSAHFLQESLDMGNSQGQPSAIQTSRSALGISEGLAVPQWMLEGAYALFATTGYGRRFLEISKPFIDGAVFSVGGATQV